MRKIISLIAVSTMVLGTIGCTSKETSSTDVVGSSTIKGTYSRYVQGDDWGAGVSSITLTLDNPVDTVDDKTFTVSETKDDTDWTDPSFATVSKTMERTVIDSYLIDENGEKTEKASNYVKIDMEIDPNNGSPFQFNPITGRNVWTSYTLDVGLSDDAKLTSGGKDVTKFVIDEKFTDTKTSADEFEYDSYTAKDGTNYKYAYYEPEKDSKTLVVWLHGGGEGGGKDVETDPSVVLLANEAANLGSEEFQTAVGGANILVPQCPTYWIDDGNFEDGASAEDVVMKNSGTSLYTDSLVELIDDYKEKTGSEKVVLVGCSNGGFMTLLLGKTYPEKYDALVPICGPLSLDKFTKDEIKAIKDKPMYFVWASNDTTVPPESFEVPTIKAFEKAGFTNLHYSNTDSVPDTTGRFFLDDEGNMTIENTGTPYEYTGHWSWIYFFNNETSDKDGKTAWDFIAENVK